ncbi:MAG: TniQ family protein [Bacillota bacterium]
MNLPNRSKLISLPPYSLDSPYVESMTSYIKRHAELLKVQTGIFIKHVIGEEINDLYVMKDLKRGASRFIERSSTINGTHQLAESCVSMFERLTTLNQLDRLTLLSWRGRITSLDLLKQRLSWCPLCFHDWKTNNHVQYEPLLWMISGITICPIHNCYLHDHCPHCKNNMPILTNKSKIGFCSICNESLYKDTSIETQPHPFEVKASLFIFNILFTPDFKHSPNSFIKEWMDQQWDGCCLHAAKSFGIPFSTLLQWIKNECLVPFPRFYDFLIIYFKANTSNDLGSHHSVLPNEFPIFKKPPSILEQYKKVCSLLESCINEEPPISLQAAVNRTPFSIKTIKKHYPELSRIIKEKYADHVSKRSKLGLDLLCKEIISATYEIASSGEYPSSKLVEKKIGKIGALKRREVLDAWRLAKYQLGVDPRWCPSFDSNNKKLGADNYDDG